MLWHTLDLAKITGDVRTTKKVSIPPLETIQVQGTTKIKCHSKRLHVMAEAPAKIYLEHLMTASIYKEL